MTPPKDSGQGSTAAAPDLPSAVCVCAAAAGAVAPVAVAPVAVALVIETLRNRPDFLRAAQARRQGTGSFLVQGRARGDGVLTVRIGFTATKKIGNAVLRNRAKRRLRALARDVLPELARPGWDYVLVARPAATVTGDFARMRADLAQALQRLHQDRP